MPSPAKPYIPSVATGLSTQEVTDADKDYLYFLRHIRLDGDAYTVAILFEDSASSPPWVIRYEQPVPITMPGPSLRALIAKDKGPLPHRRRALGPRVRPRAA